MNTKLLLIAAAGVTAALLLRRATTPLVVTAKTSNFTGGTIRLVLTYLKFSAPTA